MRSGIARGILAGALWLLADAAPVWPQSANTAALVNSFVGVGTTAVTTLGNLAAQQRAAAMQQQQFEAQQRADELQQERQAPAYRSFTKCPTGYRRATVLFSDGSKHRMCVEEEP
jgi:hypothetical protein